MASVNARVSYQRGSELDRILTRATNPDSAIHRTPAVIRRMLFRYDQLVTEAAEPESRLVVIIGDAVVQHNVSLLWGDRYPPKGEILKLISDLAVPEVERQELAQIVEEMSFADYARLIEAIETFHFQD